METRWKPAAAISRATSGVTIVPLVAKAVGRANSFAYAASSCQSPRSSGSPPEKTIMGLPSFDADRSICRACSVVMSPLAGPLGTSSRRQCTQRRLHRDVDSQNSSRSLLSGPWPCMRYSNVPWASRPWPFPNHGRDGRDTHGRDARVTESLLLDPSLRRCGGFQPDLFIRQLAGRIVAPDIAGDRLGPGAEVSVADIQPTAIRAARAR